MSEQGYVWQEDPAVHAVLRAALASQRTWGWVVGHPSTDEDRQYKPDHFQYQGGSGEISGNRSG